MSKISLLINTDMCINYTEKECFKCGETKPLNQFYKHKQMLDGHLGKCIECSKKDVIENRNNNQSYYNNFDCNRYRNNILRIWKHKYHSMFRRIKGLNKHSNLIGKEILSQSEFINWCKETENIFMKIHKEWSNSNYERKLSPSIDRIDNSKGYILGNMQWITQSQNSKKYTF